MGTEVAVESDSGLAGRGDSAGMGRDRDFREHQQTPFFFPGLLDLCAAPLLECIHGVSGPVVPLT